MKAFIKFNQGVLQMPLQWRMWMLLLVTANFFAPLFFLNHTEAWLVLLAFMASVTLMMLLTSRFGFSRIVGLGHIVWVPMLAFLFTRIGDVPAENGFEIWLQSLFMLNAISVIIDAVDVTRYIAGERLEIVPAYKQSV